jgi:hypothetical protein
MKLKKINHRWTQLHTDFFAWKLSAFICVNLWLILFLSVAINAQSINRGYTIPIVDLASDVNRQTIVDREAGQYLGHPTTVLLEDKKTIITVYPKGHGRGAILMKRSIDGGKTWSERLPTPKNWETSLETPTIHRVIDKLGKKRLIIFSGLYPIRMAVSEDDGKNWSELKPIGNFGGIVAMGSVERLKNGDYAAFFHDDALSNALARRRINVVRATGTFQIRPNSFVRTGNNSFAGWQTIGDAAA